MLTVERLELRDWRNFRERSVELAPGLNVLVGRNAVGKTTIVEALQLLTAGASFRGAGPAQLVRAGAERGRASARLVGDGRVIDVSCDVAPGRRIFSRNGKRARAHELPETLMSVLFCPDDLSLVKRGASGRRDELDGFGWQANPGYGRVLRAYLRAVEQRNRLLRDEAPDLALLDAWDASVALGAAALLQARLRLVERLRPHLASTYAEIAGGESLTCEYACSLLAFEERRDAPDAPVVGAAPAQPGSRHDQTGAGAALARASSAPAAPDGLLALGRDELAGRFADALAAGRADDLRRHQTLVGPHRDDLLFSIDGRAARDFASQGQQRSVVLAWKMAEVALAEELLGARPLLLLDDVMSELDVERRAAATRFVRAGMQTVVTTANLGYFSDELLEGANVIAIE